MTGAVLAPRELVAYGALAFPLAMAGLPLFVHVPKFYGDTLGVDLAVVGGVLLALRLFDCVLDPLLGAWSDRLRARSAPIAWSMPVLVVGMIALFAPPPGLREGGLVWWLAASLAVVYAAYSLATISHNAWGAELSADPHQRTRITATREGLALAGVLLAAIVPALAGDAGAGLRLLSWLFAAALLVFGGVTVAWAPASRRRRPELPLWQALRAVQSVPAFRHLLLVYVVNGVAAAIPATLVLFFIKDVIGAEPQQGWFLAVYFVAGAVAMPFWVALASRTGKARAWLAAMGLAVASFVWSLGLHPGDAASFLVVCAASGIALSADLALPPSLLADAIDRGPPSVGAGAYFGVWTLATKLNLALAAGIALPLVHGLGYRPGAAPGEGATALAIVYAGVPCALKLAAAFLAWRVLAREPWSVGRGAAGVRRRPFFSCKDL